MAARFDEKVRFTATLITFGRMGPCERVTFEDAGLKPTSLKLPATDWAYDQSKEVRSFLNAWKITMTESAALRQGVDLGSYGLILEKHEDGKKLQYFYWFKEAEEEVKQYVGLR